MIDDGSLHESEQAARVFERDDRSEFVEAQDKHGCCSSQHGEFNALSVPVIYSSPPQSLKSELWLIWTSFDIEGLSWSGELDNKDLGRRRSRSGRSSVHVPRRAFSQQSSRALLEWLSNLRLLMRSCHGWFSMVKVCLS